MTDISTDQRTPISGKKVREIHPDKWEEMKLDELQAELSALQERLTMAEELNMNESRHAINNGLEQLRTVIERRFGTYAANTFLL